VSTIIHLDLDSFFVSVERILDPSLKGKPVIVGANPEYGRGVVAACSYEAREYGLHSAMPIRQAYRQCPHGVYLQGNHREYSRFSKAVERLLKKYAHKIERGSIDEFYMDFTGTRRIYKSAFVFARQLQTEVEEKLGLPCSIGIGSNKTIAKIASDYAKPKGVTYVLSGMEKDFLAPLPVEVIPGVGKVMKQKLNERGFYLVGDIARVPYGYFAAAFGSVGIDIWEKANGKGSIIVAPPYEQKSISSEHTFLKDEINKGIIEATLFELTAKVGQLLRNKQVFAKNVSVKLRYSDFVTFTRSKQIFQTDDDKILFDTAKSLLEKAFTRRVSVRLIGIRLSGFCEAYVQAEIFEDEITARRKLFEAITKIRNKYGYSAIKFGVSSTPMLKNVSLGNNIK